MRVDGRGDDVVGEAGAFPDLRAGFEIVAANALGGADDDLWFAIDFHDEGSGPGGDFVAFRFPELFAGGFIEGVDEGVAFVIPVDDEFVAVEDGGTAFAVGVEGLHFAEILLPEDGAFEIQAVEAARTEEGVEVLAIGDGGI